MKNVLFLCTGNSCRSVLAEAYMNATGAGRWQAFSAGSTPTGTVHPMALATLKELGLIHTGYRAHFREVFAMIKKRLDAFLAAEGK